MVQYHGFLNIFLSCNIIVESSNNGSAVAADEKGLQ